MPWVSVMVTMVVVEGGGDMRHTHHNILLFFLAGARSLAAGLLMHQPWCYLVTFFLPAMALAGPLRVRALVWVRWPRTGRLLRWRKAAVAAQIHQALDVHGGVAAQIAFHQEVAVDDFADLDDFGFGQIAHPALGIEMPKLGG